VGVIDWGWVAIVKGFRTHPGAQVVALADRTKRLEEIGKHDQGVQALCIRRKMLEEAGYCQRVTPNKLQAAGVCGLRAGCHVLCEKPMAMNAAEAGDMLAAAKEGETAGDQLSYRFTEQHGAETASETGAIGGSTLPGRSGIAGGLPGLGGWFGQKALSGGGTHRPGRPPTGPGAVADGYPQPEWVLGSALADQFGPGERKEGGFRCRGSGRGYGETTGGDPGARGLLGCQHQSG
jgi:hypothetical protein